MKKQLLNLTLFSESADGGSGDGDGNDCAAEQSETVPVNDKETAAEANVTADSMLTQIAAALGMEGADGAALLAGLNSAKTRRALEARLKEKHAAEVYRKLFSEAELLKGKISGFDLKTELGDRRFAAMLKSGLSVEDAWCAVHFRQLLEAAVRLEGERAQNQALAKLRYGASRPSENGASGHSAAESRTRVESLTGKGIRDILRLVEKGARVKF